MFGILPRENAFFEIFIRTAANIREAAGVFLKTARGEIKLDEAAVRIKELEHVGDKMTHETMEILHRTFITPIEREDIQEITNKLDDIIDLIDCAASKMNLYEVKERKEPVVKLAEILDRAVKEISNALEKFQSYKRSTDILPFCVLVNEFENEADDVFRQGIAELFKKEKDPIEVIKWKEILGDVETAVDKCEDVAILLEGVVVKNA